MHILINISRSNEGNQTMTFGQLIEYNLGNIAVSKMYILNPNVFFFWNSPLLNGLPFNKLGNAGQGNLQLGDIAYFSKFSKLGEEKCLIR